MCRNIKRLRRPDGAPTDPELHDAALQFIRKISGYRVPSLANRDAFDTAVDEVAASARRMFDTLRTPASGARRAHETSHHESSDATLAENDPSGQTPGTLGEPKGDPIHGAGTPSAWQRAARR
jgi:hypothetical protein